MSNCTKGTYHGYWAVDFVGAKGDPVYAAGAGVMHIGDIDPGCKTSATDIEAGTWVWVDHGGGRITRYYHLGLDRGQGGTAGHADDGDRAHGPQRRRRALHHELPALRGPVGRRHGSAGQPRFVARLHSAGPHPGADALGVTSWNEPACPGGRCPLPPRRPPASTDTWDATPARPSASVGSRPQSALVSWNAPPAGANQVTILQERWSPSLRRFGWPTYVVTSATSRSRTFAGLTDGWTYRYSVAFHNTYGNSAWSTPVTIVPASVPSVPEAPRFLTSPTRDYIHYGWWKSTDNGSAVTSYRAARRCLRNGVYGDWAYATSPARSTTPTSAD